MTVIHRLHFASRALRTTLWVLGSTVGAVPTSGSTPGDAPPRVVRALPDAPIAVIGDPLHAGERGRVVLMNVLTGDVVRTLEPAPDEDHFGSQVESYVYTETHSTALIVLCTNAASKGPGRVVGFDVATGRRLWGKDIQATVGSLALATMAIGRSVTTGDPTIWLSGPSFDGALGKSQGALLRWSSGADHWQMVQEGVAPGARMGMGLCVPGSPLARAFVTAIPRIEKPATPGSVDPTQSTPSPLLLCVDDAGKVVWKRDLQEPKVMCSQLVGYVSDVNHDGYDDVILQHDQPHEGGGWRGRVEVASGHTGLRIRDLDLTVYDGALGGAVSVGDVGEDGVVDIVLGDPSFGLAEGAVVLASSSTGHILRRSTFADDFHLGTSLAFMPYLDGFPNGCVLASGARGDGDRKQMIRVLDARSLRSVRQCVIP